MKNLKIVGPMILFALIVGGCNSSPNSSANANVIKNDAPTQAMAPKGGMSMEPQTPAALTDAQSQQLSAGAADHAPTSLTFDVTGGSFYFTPNVIHVKKGDKVKIVFNNAGGMHNFNIDEFGVSMSPIKTGETVTLGFTADKTGSFEYYCSVGKHRMMGQKGTLIVE